MITITTNPKQQDIIHDIMLQLYDPNIDKPKRGEEEPAFSEDICIIDENGLHGVACFSFELDLWVFHYDTLVDYREKDKTTKWKWYYPPISNKDIEW
jgi:hypothetical protein